MSYVCKEWNTLAKDYIKATHIQQIFDAIGLTPEHCKVYTTTAYDLVWTFETIIEAIFAPEADNYTRKNNFFDSQIKRCKVKYKNKPRLLENKIKRQSYLVYSLID